jgi:hypothetical protein
MKAAQALALRFANTSLKTTSKPSAFEAQKKWEVPSDSRLKKRINFLYRSASFTFAETKFPEKATSGFTRLIKQL